MLIQQSKRLPRLGFNPKSTNTIESDITAYLLSLLRTITGTRASRKKLTTTVYEQRKAQLLEIHNPTTKNAQSKT